MRPGALACLLGLACTVPAAAQFKFEPKEELRDAPNGPPPLDEEPERVVPSTVVGTGYTVIPLPAFVYNRNERTWIGGLLPIFKANPKGEVEDIYAPLYLHNETIGETFTFEYLGYREHTTQFHAILSQATKVEHQYDFGYQNTYFGERNLIVSFQGVAQKSAFNRFYGFGNQSSQSAESNYALDDNYVKVGVGPHLGEDGALLFSERFRNVSVLNGPITSLPQTRDEFPNLQGLDGGQIWAQGITLLYDTRDSQLTPSQGTYATLFGEYLRNYDVADKTSWFRLTGDARHYMPHGDGRMTFVSRLMLDAVVGEDVNQRGVPFYSRPTLGGDTTLRGYGNQRYVNNVAVLVNLEERISILSRSILGNRIELEVAPFLDMGRVGTNFSSDRTVKHMQFNPGIGVRALARPNIAARMDVAEGKEGANVFVGLDYPF